MVVQAALPENESERIAALLAHHLQDVIAEPAFGRLAAQAADLLDAEQGFVTIVSSSVQCLLGTTAAEAGVLPRSDSFCAHGLVSDDVMVVPDAQKDPRFADNPLVTRPAGLRFYAGAPLILAEGIRAGMVCVTSSQPRPAPDVRQLARLAALAGTAVDMIRLRVGALTAQNSERHARAAQRDLVRTIEDLEARERVITEQQTLLRTTLETVDAGIGVITAQQTLLQTTLETVDVGIAVIDADLRVALSNDRYFEMLGVPEPLRRTGVPLAEVIRAWATSTVRMDEPIDDFVERRMASLNRRESRRAEAETRDGRHLLFQRTAMSDGRFLITVTDVTEARIAERRKDEFVATVSHELRTPLTSIAGSLGLLRGGAAGPLEPRVARMIEIAAANSERLVRLINDILDIEKLTSRSGAMRFEALDAQRAAEACLDSLRGYTDTFGVHLRLEIAPDAPGRIRADPDRFAQVVTNLVSNAVKFSPPSGEVTVRLAEAPSRTRLRLTVADRGPGIPAAFRKRLFERFAQADASDARRRGGTGLGLAIVKEIVEQHGGEIDLDTKEGEGTAFHVDFPLAEAPHRTGVVLRDGSAATGDALAGALEGAGISVRRAGTLSAAIEAMEAVPSPAAVIVGPDLPAPEAQALVRAIRTRPSFGGAPVLVIAGNKAGEPGDAKVSAIEVVDWLEAPGDLRRLASTVQGAGGLVREADSRPCVLHVEDDEDLLALSAETLRTSAELIAARTIGEARAALETNRIELVILDLALKDESGRALLPDIARAGRRRGERIPVIVFSAYEAEPLLAEQVDATLLKGLSSLDGLLETVRRVAGKPPAKNVAP